MTKNLAQINRRKSRVRKKLNGIQKHRLHIFRSSRHIYASVTSIKNDVTICSFSSEKIKKTEEIKKTDIAKEVGLKIAELAMAAGIKDVKFDKGPYKYHGRLKSLADAAREKGLLF